jgi:hypothetical protein
MRIRASGPVKAPRLKPLNCSEARVLQHHILPADEKSQDLFTLTENEKRALRLMPLATVLPIVLSFYYWWMQYHFLLASGSTSLSTALIAQRGYIIIDVISNGT